MTPGGERRKVNVVEKHSQSSPGDRTLRSVAKLAKIEERLSNMTHEMGKLWESNREAKQRLSEFQDVARDVRDFQKKGARLNKTLVGLLLTVVAGVIVNFATRVSRPVATLRQQSTEEDLEKKLDRLIRALEEK